MRLFCGRQTLLRRHAWDKWRCNAAGDYSKKFGNCNHNRCMTHTPLIELTRGGTLECQHFGSIAVSNAQGKLLAFAGDPHWLTFTRSTLKALQALPFVQAGGPAKMGFNTEQIALLCASHGGEDMHVAQVQGMLDKSGLVYKALC